MLEEEDNESSIKEQNNEQQNASLDMYGYTQMYE